MFWLAILCMAHSENSRVILIWFFIRIHTQACACAQSIWFPRVCEQSNRWLWLQRRRIRCIPNQIQYLNELRKIQLNAHISFLNGKFFFHSKLVNFCDTNTLYYKSVAKKNSAQIIINFLYLSSFSLSLSFNLQVISFGGFFYVIHNGEGSSDQSTLKRIWKSERMFFL